MKYNHEVIVPNEDLPFKMFLFEGSLTFYLNDVEQQLHPGEFVIVNSNEIHAIDAPCPNQTVVVQMALKTFQDYFTEEQYIWFTHESTTQAAGCNALGVYLGNFGPEISETLLCSTSTIMYPQICIKKILKANSHIHTKILSWDSIVEIQHPVSCPSVK